jgi:glycosyltransferase involved in cell wall biosynthesis
MRILTVAHRFPPRHQGGAEVYSLRLARGLAERHEVVVMTADDKLSHRNYSRRGYEIDGIRVVEFTNHRRYQRFEDSYADGRMERHFRAVIRAVQPDVVHFQHLMHHSSQLPLIAWDQGVPSVATLHEYWMLCGRNGQMIREDGERCAKPGLNRCSSCMAGFSWGRKGLDVWALRGIAGVKTLTGLDLKARARRVRLDRREIGTDDEPSAEAVTEFRRNLLLREARMRDAFESVALWLAPSEFLRSQFIAAGFDGERIAFNRLGIETSRYRRRTRTLEPGRPLRVGFVGSVQPVKGVHVLVEALRMLAEAGVEVEADICGDLSAKPEYVDQLRASLGDRARLHGRVPIDEVPDRMDAFDVMVVPSVWWENSPLTIQEAQAAQLPVVTSDIGGMAELVRHETDGLLFPVGDSAALAASLQRLVEEPMLLQSLSAAAPKPVDMKSDVRFHEKLFETVRSYDMEF